MADYKESEKIPAELLAYFHGLMMAARVEAATKGYDVKPLLREIEAMLLCLMAHLDHRDTDFSEAVKCFNLAFLSFCNIIYENAEKVGKGNEINFEEEQHMTVELLKKWGRMNDISRNSIILPGYTLVDMIVWLNLGALMCVTWKDDGRVSGKDTGYMACGIFATIIIYIAVLVRKLDDPFDWPSAFHFNTYVNGAPIALTFSEELWVRVFDRSSALCVDLKCQCNGRGLSPHFFPHARSTSAASTSSPSLPTSAPSFASCSTRTQSAATRPRSC